MVFGEESVIEADLSLTDDSKFRVAYAKVGDISLSQYWTLHCEKDEARLLNFIMKIVEYRLRTDV